MSGRRHPRRDGKPGEIMTSMECEFWLGEEHREMRSLVRQVARERIAPHAAHVDETESHPAEQLKVLGEQIYESTNQIQRLVIARALGLDRP